MKVKIFYAVAVVVLALALTGCAKGMVRADAIKPAVDIIVPEYIALIPDEDPLKAKKKALAEELKQTIDLAAGGE